MMTRRARTVRARRRASAMVESTQSRFADGSKRRQGRLPRRTNGQGRQAASRPKGPGGGKRDRPATAARRLARPHAPAAGHRPGHRHRRCDRHRRRHRHARPDRPGRRRPLPQSGGPPGRSRRASHHLPPGNENRFVEDEVVLEFASNFPQAGIAATAGAARAEPARIADLHADQLDLRPRPYRQPAPGARGACRAFGNEAMLRAGQPNYLYPPRRARAARSRNRRSRRPRSRPRRRSRPAAIRRNTRSAKLRIGEAHKLANGDKILVAVIDSGIDLGHPELRA